MTRWTGKWVAIWLCLGLAGCVSNQMTTFVDPDYSKKTYQKILITPISDDLAARITIEKYFNTAFGGTRTEGVPSARILLPTRKYTDQELFAQLQKNQIDAVLIIEEREYYEEQHYIPESSTTTTTGRLSANTYYYGSSSSTSGTVQATSHTIKRGGYYVNNPRIRHRLSLYDVASRRLAWVGASLTKNDTKTYFSKGLIGRSIVLLHEQDKFNDMYRSLANSTVARLTKEGLVKAKTR